MDDFTQILDQLFHNVMETDDFKTTSSSSGGWVDEPLHELEVSPFVFDCLKCDVNFMQHNFDMFSTPHKWKFRGMFKLKFVHEGIPDGPVGGPDAPSLDKCTIPQFCHIALRVECRNGRFSYFDWDKNRESMK